MSAALMKRQYLLDLKPFSYLYSPVNITTQLANAAVVTALPLMNEYNQHMTITLERLEKGQKTEDFDWDNAIERYLPGLKANIFKFFTISTFTRLFEMASVRKLFAPRFADKLVKDAGKSLTRKLLRMTRATACGKIMKTYMFSTAISSLSFLLYDALERLYILRTSTDSKLMWDAKGRPKTFLTRTREYLNWLCRKIILSGITLAGGGIGYGLMGYLNHPLGSSLGAMIFNASFNIMGAMLLQL